MEVRIVKFCCAYGILLLFGSCFALQTEVAFDPIGFRQKLNALNKALNFVYKSTETNFNSTYEGAFAITLTIANLVATLEHKNALFLGNTLFEFLEETITLAISIQDAVKHPINSQKIHEFFVYSKINNPDMWIRPILWTEVSSFATLNYHDYNNQSEILKSIWYGKSGVEIDECLFNMTVGYTHNNCQIPETCIKLVIEHDDSTGYFLLQKLLIVQIAKIFKCQEIKSFSNLVPAFCSNMLQYLFYFEMWNFPSVTPDLMTKQIILCGMAGYLEFVNQFYAEFILNWQGQSGCFSIFGYPKKRKTLRKSINFGCDPHATANIAAALALFIRENIENAKWS